MIGSAELCSQRSAVQPSAPNRRVTIPLPLTFNGDSRSNHGKILRHGDKRQLSGAAFDKSEGHPGGFYRPKAAPPAKNDPMLATAEPLDFDEDGT
jgi:hypothetical protein